MATDNTVLQPGVSIKPKVNENDVKEILKDFYGLKCVSIKELNGYDDNNYLVKVEAKCESDNIDIVNEDGYILKVVNSLDSQRPQFFEAQNELLIYLGKTRVCCPRPVQTKDSHYYIIKNFSSGRHIVRLLEFISGSILHEVPPSKDLFYQCGKYVAELDDALKNFHHSAYDNHTTVWQLESVPQLSQFLFAVTDTSRRKIVEEVIEDFSKKVLPISHRLAKGVIHGDFNEQNILVQEKDGQWSIKGILDFGDSQFSCYVYELALAMTYMMIQGKSIDVGGHVLAGYSSVCIAGRFCQTLVLGAYSILQDPENSYILTTSKSGWTLLEELWAQPDEQLLHYWKTFLHNDKSE